MKLGDLDKVQELAKHQGELAKLLADIGEGRAVPIVRVHDQFKADKALFPYDYVEISDISEGCLELVEQALLQGIREMQKINKDALAQYGVTEE